ncbi:type II secretion system F family protein [uncultured Microbacterium sp.]|uniref:type II secretion system F family protein n=1 Tax=uncultured Microbacterium sp. TaxID=191216 RepID=UPI0025DF6A2E|nr:type II secretion system F family protein [uncultured Microbacterium sp.]
MRAGAITRSDGARRERRGSRGAGTVDPVETVMRLAVLLAAGLPPAGAWAHLAAGASDDTLRSVADAAARGADVGYALRCGGDAWVEIAAVWTVAVETGAPLAETLRAVAVALRDAKEVAADVRVALAEPAATARLLGWLPLLGIPMGAALGVDTVGILTTEPLGAACLGSGLALVGAGRLWTRRLTRSASPPPAIPGLRAELWAVALSAGASVDRARAVVASSPLRAAGSPTEENEAVDATLELAVRAGVPAVELLRGDAWLARHRARADGRAAAARLSTRLLIPLGACTLPAFLLLAVAPMMLGLLRSPVLP